MSWLSKLVSGVKSVAKGVSGGVSSVAKSVTKGVGNASKFAAKTVAQPVKAVSKFVDKNAKEILSVGGAVAGGIVGTMLLPGIGTGIGSSLGGSLGGNAKNIAKGNLKSIPSALVGAGVSGVTAGISAGKFNGVISKVVPTGTTATISKLASSKVGTSVLAAKSTISNVVSNAKSTVSNVVKTNPVTSTLAKGTVSVLNAKTTVSNVLKSNPLTSAVATLGTVKIAQMTSKAVEVGKVNVNSVKQTLEKAKIPVTSSNVSSLSTAIKLSAGTLLDSPVPTVSEMTKTKAKSILPSFEKVKEGVKSSGKIDMSKVEETLKKTGQNISYEAIKGLGDALDNALPQIETPKVNEKTNYLPYVIGGAGVLGLLYAILKK